jgi:hypothetical protein
MRYQTIPSALEKNRHPSVRRQVASAPSGLRLLAAVLREAIAAHRRYERLKNSGLPDATAVREAFFGPSVGDKARGAMRTPFKASGQVPHTFDCHGEATWGLPTIADGSADPTLEPAMPI